ncbi:hypothetical protein KH5_12920 [Urechidicola sp. KH5]
MKAHLIILSLLISGACFGQQNVYEEISKTVNSDWISTNPDLENTDSSFFNNLSSETSFVVPIKISGLSIPFSWDCDLSILKFLLSQDSNISIKKGKDADSNYLGIKIDWTEKKSSLIYLNNKFYNASIDNWYLFGQTDCPGTILFPVLNFDKLFDVQDARTNNLNGIAIIPYNSNISQIIETETQLLTTDKKEISGTGYDLNSDDILDVFIYYETLDDEGMTGYKRMYLNVDGRWICKWSEYYEECM